MEQWEEDDEPLPPDELPEGHPDRPQPQIDISKNLRSTNSVNPQPLLPKWTLFLFVYSNNNNK